MALIEDINQLASGNPTLQSMINDENAYIDQLLEQNKGDLKLVLDEIDARHSLALGTDDVERAAFLAKVANKLEERIGRIPYDYETKTTREIEDFARGSKRIGENKTLALNRLAEDEKVAQQQLDIAKQEERDAQGESLNARGLLTGTREQTVGLGAKDVGKLEEDLRMRQEALGRSVGRTGFDITQESSRGMEDILRGKERNLADITTDARRGALDVGLEAKFGRAKAQASADKAAKELERKRKLGIATAVGTSYNLQDYMKRSV